MREKKNNYIILQHYYCVHNKITVVVTVGLLCTRRKCQYCSLSDNGARQNQEYFRIQRTLWPRGDCVCVFCRRLQISSLNDIEYRTLFYTKRIIIIIVMYRRDDYRTANVNTILHTRWNAEERAAQRTKNICEYFSIYAFFFFLLLYVPRVFMRSTMVLVRLIKKKNRKKCPNSSHFFVFAVLFRRNFEVSILIRKRLLYGKKK